MAVGWTGGDITFYWDDTSPTPEPVSFGERIDGYTLNAYPIGNSVINPLLSPAYYQRITTEDTWLRVKPTVGSIPPGTSADIEVIADATGLEVGTYQGQIIVSSNDPENPTVEIPVNLTVEALNCTDNDNDGITTCDGDCNDNNPNIFPNAPEICDNLDNNCDGQIDENGIEDFDNDGFAICDGDCDDTNPNTFPNAPEICDNLDNNCNGIIDEGGVCGADSDGDGLADAQDNCPNLANNEINYALDFDGSNDFIRFDDEFLFHQSGDASLSFWVLSHKNTHGSVIWSKTTSAPDANRFNIFSQGGVAFDYREPSGSISGHIFGGTPFFPTQTWVHIALVRKENLYLRYFNGKLLGCVEDLNPNLPTAIGWALSGWSSFRFDGQLDEFRIWNYARSNAEIQADMNKKLTGNESGLHGYWNFDEGEGNILGDLTGNSDGKLGNLNQTSMPQWIISGAPLTNYNNQKDTDNDGVGDACDDDDDGDGITDDSDNCLIATNGAQLDSDGDGVGNACDICPFDNPNDSDKDGVCDQFDICPNGDDLLDCNGNGIPDACDLCLLSPNDDDGDGFTECQGDCNDNNATVFQGQ